MQSPLPPVLIPRVLFDRERHELVAVLESLTEAEWQAPTVCEGWAVRDVVAHVVGDDLGPLSALRDGYTAGRFTPSSFEELVALINRANETWVAAMRRVSPGLLVELLGTYGPEYARAVTIRDQFALGGPVDWAGFGPQPVWLDTAREFSERWLHQQHVREATGRPSLYGPDLLGPVLATFVHSLPRAYEGVGAPEGTSVLFEIRGPAGLRRALLREAAGWTLAEEQAGPTAAISIDQDTAWRMFTRGISPEAASGRARATGRDELAAAAFKAVAILA